jgi:stage V sporulation protein B
VEKNDNEAARTAGRGGVAVLGAKVFFIVVGFIQQPLLNKVLGLDGYGALSRILAIANVVNNVVVSSSTQGVSRVVSRAPGYEKQALRAALRVHVPLAVVLAILFAAAAPLLARFHQAPHILWPLIVLSGVVLVYGMYAPLVGAINGRRLFGRQAKLDVTFAVLRTAGLAGVGFLFVKRGLSGTLGATVGFVAAAACILPLAFVWAGAGAPGDHESIPRPRAYVRQILTIASAQFFTNALMQVDITILGRFLSLKAATPEIADEWVGVYRACQLFAFLPYQLLFSVTQVLFPMLARAHADGDNTAVKRFVLRGSRIGAIVCGLLVSIVVALPQSLLGFAYSAVVAERGAATLRVLALGQAAFAMVAIALTILTSLGREALAARITALACVMVGVICWVLVPMAGFGEEQLQRTAVATTGTLAVALLFTGGIVHKRTGGFVPLLTIVRVGIAVSACITAGLYLPRFGRLVTPVAAAAVAVVYAVILLATRELTGDDLAAVKAIVSRQKKT